MEKGKPHYPLTVVRALTIQDFYKSMTTHADHRVWQDVYRPSTDAGVSISN
jgi:motility quorum-sensing regulator/GCU-specific mRNA interferase toxin